MRITNKYGFDPVIVEAVRNDGYSRGECDFTATELIAPPRQIQLIKKHKEEITEDVSNLIYVLMGKLGHGILEKAASKFEKGSYEVEKRYFAPVVIEDARYTISAQIDLFSFTDKCLSDYKFTSVHSIKNGVKEEYTQQLNIQAAIMRENGIEVKKAQIVAILRDWSKMEYARELARFPETNYPSSQCVLLEVPLWGKEVQDQFIMDRIKLHAGASKKLPECTKEERWARDDSYAVMKEGAKRAHSLHESEEAAKLILTDLGKHYSIVKRPGASIRCENYCRASDFCEQWRRIKCF